MERRDFIKRASAIATAAAASGCSSSTKRDKKLTEVKPENVFGMADLQTHHGNKILTVKSKKEMISVGIPNEPQQEISLDFIFLGKDGNSISEPKSVTITTNGAKFNLNNLIGVDGDKETMLSAHAVASWEGGDYYTRSDLEIVYTTPLSIKKSEATLHTEKTTINSSRGN